MSGYTSLALHIPVSLAPENWPTCTMDILFPSRVEMCVSDLYTSDGVDRVAEKVCLVSEALLSLRTQDGAFDTLIECPFNMHHGNDRVSRDADVALRFAIQFLHEGRYSRDEILITG